jgi:hypothetical protein
VISTMPIAMRAMRPWFCRIAEAVLRATASRLYGGATFD